MTQRFIWKYVLRLTDEQVITLPFGATIIHVGNQNKFVCLWASVKFDTTPYTVLDRKIYIFGTGNPLPENFIDLNYLGTVITMGFVWHVYDGGIIINSMRHSE